MEETVFSILIVLIFTLAYRALGLLPINADFLFTDSTTIFRAALGAVLAWGMIDAIMYTVFSVFERRDLVRILNSVQASSSVQEGLDILSEEFGYIFEPITEDDQRHSIYVPLLEALRETEPKQVRIEKEDLLGAVAVFFAAILAVVPSLAPLLIFRANLSIALQLSNLFSFIMLFITGYRWGKYSGYKPILMGLVIMSIALFMVLLAIPLGG